MVRPPRSASPTPQNAARSPPTHHLACAVVVARPRVTSSARRAGWTDRYGGDARKGSDILVQALEREGVDTVFAYPGGASMEIHQALTRSDAIRNILCRHEQARPPPHATARPATVASGIYS